MQLRRIISGADLYLELRMPQGWISLPKCLAGLSFRPAAETAMLSGDILAVLQAAPELRGAIEDAARSIDPEKTSGADVVMPFGPRSFRDFMLYEAHAIAAARGFVHRFMPRAARVVSAYEGLTRRTFPRLKPHALWYRQPIYYMGNHLTFATDGEDIAIPSYA